MLSVTVKAETLQGLRAKIVDVLAKNWPEQDADVTVKNGTVTVKTDSRQMELPLAKKKKIKKVAATPDPVGNPNHPHTEPVKVEAKETASAVESYALPAGQPVLREDIEKALQKVAVTKGLPAAKAMLPMFGVKRISDLPTKDYLAFVVTCNKRCQRND